MRFALKPGRHAVTVTLNHASRRLLARSRKHRLRVLALATHARRRTITLHAHQVA